MLPSSPRLCPCQPVSSVPHTRAGGVNHRGKATVATVAVIPLHLENPIKVGFCACGWLERGPPGNQSSSVLRAAWDMVRASQHGGPQHTSRSCSSCFWLRVSFPRGFSHSSDPIHCSMMSLSSHQRPVGEAWPGALGFSRNGSYRSAK